MADNVNGTRIPALGRRGGGWVFIQVILFWVLIAAGVRGRGDADGFMLLVGVVTGTTLVFLGAWILWSGIRTLDHSLSAMPKPPDDGVLVTEGPYAYVRHPIYLGIILVAFGWSVAMDSTFALIVALIYVVFYDLKSRREEAWLRQKYPDYVTYAAHTRRLVPYIY